jgi:hypothetical protein
MSTRDSTYVQTGDNFFTKISNWATMIPLPFVREFLVIGAGALGGVWDSAGWLLKGKPLSAATTLGAHTASVVTNAATMLVPFWGWAANAGSVAMTGRTIGTHVRKGVEMATGAVTQPLGIQPTVLRSYPAGIGSINGGMQRPGQWATMVSQRSGRDPNQQWTEYVQQNGGAQMGVQR